MANNYSQFSEVFTFKTEEAARLFVKLAEICVALADEEISDEELELPPDKREDFTAQESRMAGTWSFLTLDKRKALLEAAECGRFDFEPDAKDPCSVWVYAEEYGNLDALGECAHEALRFCDDDTILTLTWADYCEKLRPGEFGGGYMVIHAGGVEYGNAHDLAAKAAEAVKASRA